MRHARLTMMCSPGKWFVMLLSMPVIVLAGPRGDFNGDHDIDLDDVRWFQLCFTGENGNTPTGPCEIFGFDNDGTIDLDDLGGFSRTVFGPGVFPPIVTDSATIVGHVFHAESGDPLEGVTVTVAIHPAVEGWAGPVAGCDYGQQRTFCLHDGVHRGDGYLSPTHPQGWSCGKPASGGGHGRPVLARR